MVELLSGEKQLISLDKVKFTSYCFPRFSFGIFTKIIVTNKRVIIINPRLTPKWGEGSWWYREEDYIKNNKLQGLIIRFKAKEGKIKLTLPTLLFNVTYSLYTDSALEIEEIIKNNS